MFFGELVEKVVVIVLVYFDDNQRSATKDVCAIVGLEVTCLVNELIVVFFVYGFDWFGEELCVGVIDLGGGMFDVMVFEFG